MKIIINSFIIFSLSIFSLSCTGSESTYLVIGDNPKRAPVKTFSLSKFSFSLPEKANWTTSTSNLIDSIECTRSVEGVGDNKLKITVIRKAIDSTINSELTYVNAAAILDTEMESVNQKCAADNYNPTNKSKINTIWNKKKFCGISFQIQKTLNPNIYLSDNLLFILLLPDYRETREYYLFCSSESLNEKWEKEGSKVYELEHVLKTFEIVSK